MIRPLASSATTASLPDKHAPLPAALVPARDEVGAIIGAGAALGFFYLSPWPAISALAALAFAIVAFRLPLAGALWVLWTAPWYRFPKAFDPTALGPLAAGRTAAFEVSVVETALLLTAAGWALRAVVHTSSIGSGPWSVAWWRGALISPAGALLLAAAISLPTTANLHVALRELRTVILEPLVFAFILRDLLTIERNRWHFLHGLVLLAAFVGTQGVVRYMTGAEVTEAEGVWRAGAIYWSPNHLALLLDRIAPIVLVLAVFTPAPPRLRGFYTYAAVMTAVTMALTFSRAGWLAFGTVVLALSAIRDRRALAGLAVASVLGVAAVSLYFPVERLLSAATSSQRIWLWQSSLAMLRDHLLTGVGLDNFLYAYPQYILPEAWREPDLSHPHNLVLDFWLRLGILGTFALGAMLITFARRTWLAVQSGDAWARAAANGLAAAMAASALHGLVDNSFFLIDLAYLFWALWILQDAFAASVSESAPSHGPQRVRETP